MYTNCYVKQLTKLGCTEIEHIKGEKSAYVMLPTWLEKWAGTRGYFDLQELTEDLQIRHEKLAAQEPSGESMGIDKQIRVWRDNTPVWDRFPGDGQSAVYVLGHSRETLQSIGQDGLQPNGAIVVFNARRGTVRAYCATESRIGRVNKLGFSDYGIISWTGNRHLSPSFGYCEGEPRGILLPTYDAILYCTDCAVVWNRIIVGFVPDCSLRLVRSAIEQQWIDDVNDRLRQNRFTAQLRGGFLLSFPEVSESPEEFVQIPWEPDPECSSTPMGCGESNRIRENLMLQRGYSRDAAETAIVEWRNGDRGFGWQIEMSNGDRLYWDGSSFELPHPRVDLSTSQVSELLAQLDVFGNCINAALDAGDLDRAECASLYVIQIGKILG